MTSGRNPSGTARVRVARCTTVHIDRFGYGYDDASNRLRREYVEGARKTLEYDPAGNMIRSPFVDQESQNAHRHVYDAWHRMVASEQATCRVPTGVEKPECPLLGSWWFEQ